MFSNLSSSREGVIIMSVIWGLGLSALFRKVCKGRSCIVMRGPKPDEMHNKIYKIDNKCYKYTASSTQCKGNH
jgi:hypothetical protein